MIPSSSDPTSNLHGVIEHLRTRITLGLPEMFEHAHMTHHMTDHMTGHMTHHMTDHMTHHTTDHMTSHMTDHMTGHTILKICDSQCGQ